MKNILLLTLIFFLSTPILTLSAQCSFDDTKQSLTINEVEEIEETIIESGFDEVVISEILATHPQLNAVDLDEAMVNDKKKVRRDLLVIGFVGLLYVGVVAGSACLIIFILSQ